MLAAFPGTGEVERNFSIVQGMSSHRRAGVSIEVLKTHCISDDSLDDDTALRLR